MPRYLVERTFPDGFQIPNSDSGGDRCRVFVEHNTDEGVTWLHSYVSDDKRSSFCVYDAPTPEAIRKTARLNGLPIERIIRVTVLDPYFYS